MLEHPKCYSRSKGMTKKPAEFLFLLHDSVQLQLTNIDLVKDELN